MHKNGQREIQMPGEKRSCAPKSGCAKSSADSNLARGAGQADETADGERGWHSCPPVIP